MVVEKNFVKLLQKKINFVKGSRKNELCQKAGDKIQILSKDREKNQIAPNDPAGNPYFVEWSRRKPIFRRMITEKIRISSNDRGGSAKIRQIIADKREIHQKAIEKNANFGKGSLKECIRSKTVEKTNFVQEFKKKFREKTKEKNVNCVRGPCKVRGKTRISSKRISSNSRGKHANLDKNLGKKTRISSKGCRKNWNLAKVQKKIRWFC